MAYTDIVAEILERGLGMMQKALADFSDADMLVRPVEGANHALWMLGHLCVSEAFMLSAARAEYANLLPPGFAEHFPQTKDRVNDVTAPLPKVEVLAVYEKVRRTTIAAVRGLSDADLLRTVPSPFAKGSTTTIGFLLNMPSLHSTLHLGQIQVIRRKLGKPWLF